ncbi:MAG: S41 family peptidase [Chloroflexota bacterium]
MTAQDNATHSPKTTSCWVWVMAGLLGLTLVIMVGIASFFAGRASAPAIASVVTAEPVVQIVEVTAVPEQTVIEVEEEGETDTADMSATEADETPDDPPPTPTAQPTNTPATVTPSGDPNFELFDEVWQIVAREYDGQVPTDQERVYAAIEGSLETLDDQYTRFFRPEVAARMRENLSGAVEGIGAFVRENDEGQIEIVRPIPGQPAEQAGIRPGDIIIGVDDEDVRGQSLDEVITKVRGPRGSEVELTIERADVAGPLRIVIVRTRFEVPTIEAEMLEDDIAYIRLSSFSANAESQLIETLAEMLAQNPTGLIFDLRDNPGGFLDQAIAIADIFLDEGVILFERNQVGLDQTFMAEPGGLAETIPLVVLINPGSASAAEIVAGAIQDNGRAILIGETTFGKGSVQRSRQLSDGSELRVTFARWFTPNNQTIDDQGINPDILVETDEVFMYGSEDDIQLQRALEYFGEQ